MNKKLAFLLIFCVLISAHIYSNNNYLAQVVWVKGKVQIKNIKTKTMNFIKKGSIIKKNSIIETKKNQMIMLKFSNGIKKLILPNTTFFMIDKKMENNFLKTKKILKRISILAGTKANDQSNSNNWVDEKQEYEKKIIDLFEKRSYFKIFKISNQRNFKNDSPKIIFIKAVSFLKLGLNKKSIPLFSWIIKENIFIYKKRALFGLYIAFFRSGLYQKANQIKKTLFKSYSL